MMNFPPWSLMEQAGTMPRIGCVLSPQQTSWELDQLIPIIRYTLLFSIPNIFFPFTLVLGCPCRIYSHIFCPMVLWNWHFRFHHRECRIGALSRGGRFRRLKYQNYSSPPSINSIIEILFNIFIMDFAGTPTRFNSKSSLKIASPTTAHSKQTFGNGSSTRLFENIRSSITDMIAEAEEKKKANYIGLSAVFKANSEVLDHLDPSRRIESQNQQLRRELNEALREIIRLNKIIGHLEQENASLRSRMGQGGSEGQIMSQLQQLRAEGELLRSNVIRLLKNK